MNIDIRWLQGYGEKLAAIVIRADGVTVDLGLYDTGEREEFASMLREAADDLCPEPPEVES